MEDTKQEEEILNKLYNNLKELNKEIIEYHVPKHVLKQTSIFYLGITILLTAFLAFFYILNNNVKDNGIEIKTNRAIIQDNRNEIRDNRLAINKLLSTNTNK